MEFFTKLLKTQISIVSKFADNCSVETSRFAQDKIGELIARKYKQGVSYEKIPSVVFQAEYIIPDKKNLNGIILYLHGGGYVSGGMNYAKGFGTILACQNNIPVCCVAYRLAPENKFPAALTDALNAYCYLLQNGYQPENIILCGESAGGGLVYALALKLKEEGLDMPCGIIAISPWSNLTLTGKSYDINIENDPSMTKKRLKFYSDCYTDKAELPLVSPLFGNLENLPPSLIFVGGSEILLSDSEELHKKLISCGCRSTLYISPDMWHVYLIYNLKEFEEDYKKINAFIKEVLNDG